MINDSKTPDPGTPAPSPPPGGPTHPTPTGPPKTEIYSLAESLGFGDLETPARPKTPARRDPCDVRALPSHAITGTGGLVYSGRDGKGAVERASRPVELPSGDDRAGASSPGPGAVSDSSRAGAGEPLPVPALAEGGRPGGAELASGPGFLLPAPVGPPRFELRPPRPGQPDPRPNPNPNPPPAPPPFGPLYDALPPLHCPAGQLIELGHCGCEGCARLCSACAATPFT